jgi:hypothetical protein
MVQEIYGMPPQAVVDSFQGCLARQQQQPPQQQSSTARVVQLQGHSNQTGAVPSAHLVAG